MLPLLPLPPLPSLSLLHVGAVHNQDLLVLLLVLLGDAVGNRAVVFEVVRQVARLGPAPAAVQNGILAYAERSAAAKMN